MVPVRCIIGGEFVESRGLNSKPSNISVGADPLVRDGSLTKLNSNDCHAIAFIMARIGIYRSPPKKLQWSKHV